MFQFQFFLGIILWPLFIIILGPIALMLLSVRLVVTLIAKSKGLSPIPYGDQLYTCPRGEIWAVLSGALKLDSKTDVTKLRELFSQKFLRVPSSIFYKDVVQFCGYGFTRPVPNIDLSFHIREVHYSDTDGFNPTLNSMWCENEYLQKENGRPPWEILVCNNIRGEAGSLIAIKIHHGLADGYSMVSFIDQLTGNKSPYLVKPWNISAWRKFSILLNLPLGFLKQMWELDIALTHHPFSLERASSRNIQITTSTVTLDFKKIKDIRKFTGSRILPIVMCLQVEAVKRFLKSTQRLTGKKMGKYFRHIVNLPIPEHPAMKEGRFCNHMIMGSGRVPLEEVDLLKRLRDTNDHFENYESDDMEKIAAILGPLPYLLPNFLLKHFQDISKFPLFSNLSTLVLSDKQYYLGKERIRNLYFGTVFHPRHAGLRGVTISTFTRGNDLDVCIVGSTDLFRSQGEIDLYTGKLLVEALNDYWRLCNAYPKI